MEDLTPDGELTPVLSGKLEQQLIPEHMREILRILGYDLDNQHFVRTPERAAQVLWEFRANGDDTSAAKLLEVSFRDPHQSLVIVGPIAISSMCAHHMLPVVGHAW